MKEGTRNSLIGLFMVMALGTLGALMVMIGETPAWLGGAEWELRITDVRELTPISEGTEVFLNGVNIGRVRGLNFVDPQRPGLLDKVYVLVNIKNEYSVPQDSYAKIYAPTLGIGRGRVEIIPPMEPSPKPLDRDAARITGVMANNFEDVFPQEMQEDFKKMVKNIGSFANALTPAAHDLHQLLEQRTVEQVDQPAPDVEAMTANISTVIERFDRTLKSVNAVIGDETAQADLRAVAANLSQASAELVELVRQFRADTTQVKDNFNQRLDNVDARVTEFLVAATAALEKLDATTGYLENAARDAAEGRGTVGLMLRDGRLYEAMVESFETISVLVKTLQPLAEKIAREESVPVNTKTPVGTVKRDIPLTSK